MHLGTRGMSLDFQTRPDGSKTTVGSLKRLILLFLSVPYRMPLVKDDFFGSLLSNG
jgi:hypothetical protein